MRPHGRDRGWVGPTRSRKSGLDAHHATSAAFVLEGVYQDRVFACHGLLARALGGAFGMIDAHSMQAALVLRETIQSCPNDAKGATKAPLRSSTSIRCPVYTLGNGAGPSNPELPSSSSSKNSCPVYMLGTQRCWTHSKVSLSSVRITRTDNGVRMAVKICTVHFLVLESGC